VVMDEVGEAGQKRMQRPVAAHAMLIAHDLHLQKVSSWETCSHLGCAFGRCRRR
jgi:hypothetical protein